MRPPAARRLKTRGDMNCILVAVDGSKNARLVLEHAIALARGWEARLRLLRVLSVLDAEGGDLEESQDELAEAEAAMLRIQAMVPEELREAICIERGDPARVICAAAKSDDVVAVVMGAHRHGYLARVLGTIAAYVGAHIDRPRFLVRPTVHRDAAHGEGCAEMGVPRRPHVLLEGATLVAAAGGAVVGALGGPAGVVVGGAVGAATGLLAGTVLERAERSADAHDRVLDDAIGVTTSDIGAREAAVTGLEAMQKDAATGTERVAPSGARVNELRTTHARLDALYEDLLAAYRRDDWTEVERTWDFLEPAVRAHLDREETHRLPAFASTDPDGAETLLAEHAEIRRMLDVVGLGIELHSVPRSDAESFVIALREHAARERELLYPWIDERRALDTTG